MNMVIVGMMAFFVVLLGIEILILYGREERCIKKIEEAEELEEIQWIDSKDGKPEEGATVIVTTVEMWTEKRRTLYATWSNGALNASDSVVVPEAAQIKTGKKVLLKKGWYALNPMEKTVYKVELPLIVTHWMPAPVEPKE